MAGKILALVGPSGVGKNYIKTVIRKKIPMLKELTVLTTRPKRESDGLDREAGLEQKYFFNMVENGKILAAHKPFPALDYWYGFSKEQITNLLKKNKSILTELHIDNVKIFKKEYLEKIFIIGITAKKDYLDKNIQSRGSENETERLIRLNMVEKEEIEIEKLHANKFIDKIFEANYENRESLPELVAHEVEKFINK